MTKRKNFGNCGKRSVSPLFIVLGIVLLIYSLIMIFMLLWGLNTSLKSDMDYSNRHNYLGLPYLGSEVGNSKEEFLHFGNYKLVIKNFKYQKLVNYYRGSVPVSRTTKTVFGVMMGAKNSADLRYEYFPDLLANTLVYVGGCALVSSFVPALTAYLTAKYDFKLSGIIFILYTLMMCMPIVGNQPSQLAFFKSLGIYDTIFGIVLQWASGAGMYYFVFDAYFKGVPETYREAASIDGAGEVKIMFKIYFPLAIKMIMTVFLIMFVSLWNDYQNPLIFLPTQPTLATAVYYMTNLANGTKESKIFAEAPAKMAASMVLALPILILFILTKNKLMGDISLGGIKE